MQDYRLDDLGWMNFEKLVQAILKAKFGPAVIAWGGRSDRGRDAYCEGNLNLANDGPTPGPFVFQVKFVSDANAAGAKPDAGLLSAVRAEGYEILERQTVGHWQPLSRYILITNVPMTAERREKINDKLKSAIESEKIIAWGYEDLARMLDDLPNLRVAFPQLLGIRDFQHFLSLIVNRAVVERSETARAEAVELAPVFVPTNPYYKALSVIAKHHFVVLTGPPEMGKTTIARMIGLAKHSEGWQFIDCASPDEFFQNIDDSVNQIFVADDAFGTTEYVPELATPWGQQLSKILRRLSTNRWLIWTSRPTPLAMALQHIHAEGRAAGFPVMAEVEVDAAVLNEHEKGMMLYRHAKSLQLSDYAKKVIKSCAEEIVLHRYLTPERIRRLLAERLHDLCDLLATKTINLEKLKEIVTTEITEPTRRMRQSFDNIGQERQQLLISMLDAGTGTVSEVDVQVSYRRLFGEVEETPLPQLASDLDGHFVRIHRHKQGNTYEWIHPSWRDLVIEYLKDRPQKRQRFLSGCSVHGLRLSLSLGGGATGNRRSPFIAVAADWIALTERIKSLASSGDGPTLRDVLRLIRETIVALFQEDPGSVPLELKQAGHCLLQSVLTRWNRERANITSDCLAEYCELSIIIDPIVPLPHLDNTWHSQWERFVPSDDMDYEQLSELGEELIGFLNIASANEPRLLRKYGFPRCFSEPLRNWISAISYYNAMDYWPCNSDEVDAEVDFGKSLCRLLANISVLCPQLADEAQAVKVTIEDSVHQLGRRRDIAREEVQAEDRARADSEQRAVESEMERIYWRSIGASPPSEPAYRIPLTRSSHFVASAENLPPSLSELLEDL